MATFIDVQVEAHDELPDGCSRRVKAEGPAASVTLVRYETEDGDLHTWKVVAARSDGTTTQARGVPIEDSSAGTSILVVGGDHGLRLTSADAEDPKTIAEA